MKVRMTEFRDAQWFEDGEWRSYPLPGEELETNQAHAMDLLTQGHAQPVTEERKGETRPAPDTAEKRAAKPTGKAAT